MRFKSGTYRTVLLLPFLGVAIKFPRIYIRRVIKYLWKNRHAESRSQGYDWFLNGSITSWGNLRNSLFAGIVQNSAEYRFYQLTRNSFAWPTVFSLWGLLNIQPLGIEVGQEYEVPIWLRVHRIAKDELEDMHCFAEVRNYCFDESGALYLLDYASDNSRKVLTHYGELLRGEFQNDSL